MTLFGFGIGLGGSLMGVSGGGLSTIVLTLYKQPIHNAVATSSGLAVPITIAGSIGFALAGLPHEAQLPPFSLGFVSLIGLVVMAPVASFMSPYGARLRTSCRGGRWKSRSAVFCCWSRCVSDQPDLNVHERAAITDSRAAPAGRRELPSFAAG